MKRIIAVDFDGCLCESKWPGIGDPNTLVIDRLKEAQREGAALILWTCRTGELLDNAVSWCAEHGLFFEAINDNLPETIAHFGDSPRKVSATEYWDDRAVIVTSGERMMISRKSPEDRKTICGETRCKWKTMTIAEKIRALLWVIRHGKEYR